MDVLSDEDVILTGTLERLAGKFGLSEDEPRTSLRELVRVGWVAVQTL